MTITLESLKQRLLSAELGDRMRVMGEGRVLSIAERFELACLAKDDQNARIRYDAISQMSSLGQVDLAVSLEILRDRLRNDPETDVKAAAADSIAALKLTAAFEDLIAAYQASGEWLMQFSIIAALGELGDPRGYPVLVNALDHTESLVRVAAIGALGELGDPKAVEVLIPLAQHQDWDVRHRVVQALAQLGGDRAQSTLQELTKDSAPQVADAAKAVLA
jgi:HEAT repeat protein